MELRGRRLENLWQIVAERSHEHVVDAVRCGEDRRRCCGSRRERSRPGVSGYVGILRAELQSSLGTAAQFDPETEGALEGALRIAAATAERSESVTGTG